MNRNVTYIIVLAFSNL